MRPPPPSVEVDSLSPQPQSWLQTELFSKIYMDKLPGLITFIRLKLNSESPNNLLVVSTLCHLNIL